MIDNVSIKQRVEQFDLKHGIDDAVLSLDGSMVLFPDGAKRENRWGVLMDPPSEDSYRWTSKENARQMAHLELLKRQCEYHATRHKRLVDEFTQLKQQLMFGHYSDEQLSKLKKLKQAVHAAQAQLNSAQQELADASPTDNARRMAAQAEQQRQERAAAVANIKI